VTTSRKEGRKQGSKTGGTGKWGGVCGRFKEFEKKSKSRSSNKKGEHFLKEFSFFQTVISDKIENGANHLI
jgi:hypothetical protein